MARSTQVIVSLVAVVAMVVPFIPQPSAALSVAPPNQGQLIGVCWNNAVNLFWGSHPNANSNGLQKGDMHPSDPNRFWDWLPTDASQRSYVDDNVTPGVTYTYRVKYRPELPSNEVTVTCPAYTVTPTPYPTPYPTPTPPLPNLECSPRYQSVDSGDWITFSAQHPYAGNYPYHQLAWRAVGGNPSSGAGSSFGTRFYTNSINETRHITVTDGYRTATCTVYVQGQEPVQTLSLTPTSRTIDSGTSIAFHATGGTGYYTWDAPSTVPYGGSGSLWTLYFTNTASYTSQQLVTVRSGNQTRTATIWVRPRPYDTPTPTPHTGLRCYPDNLYAQSGEEVVLRASGGTGSYNWYTNQHGNPLAGQGSFFATRFYNDTSYVHTYTVTVRSGYESDACEIHVSPRYVPSPTPYPTPTYSPVPSVSVSLDQSGRNVSDGNIAFTSSVRATGNDTVQFSLTVRNATSNTLHGVWMTDWLPSGLHYVWGSTIIDGFVTGESLTTSGMDIGSFVPGQSKVVRFSVTVDTNVIPSVGTATSYNTASVRADGTDVAFDRLPIILGNQYYLGAAAGVSTGTEDSLMIALAVALAATGLYALYAGSVRFERRHALGRISSAVQDKDRLNFVRVVR